MSRRLVLLAAVAAVGLAISLALGMAGSRQAADLAALIAASAAAFTMGGMVSGGRLRRSDLETQIGGLAASLRQASTAIEAIEAEIEERRALVATLQQEKAVAEDLLEVGTPAVNAIAQVLGSELQRAAGRSRVEAVALNTVFFALGIASGAIVG